MHESVKEKVLNTSLPENPTQSYSHKKNSRQIQNVELEYLVFTTLYASDIARVLFFLHLMNWRDSSSLPKKHTFDLPF